MADQSGPIGGGAECARGFLQHNSLVVDPRRHELLGLLHQQKFLRTPRPEGETRAARYWRVDRESIVWRRGIEAAGRPPSNPFRVHVGDRGADLFEATTTAVVNPGAVRLSFRAGRADRLWRHEPSITLTAIRIREANPPPDVEPLEWIPSTTASYQPRRCQVWNQYAA